ncbi:MAG: bifunctional nuclease family protein [Planctomycetota bacterium]|nr:bifunctional nuclease family protein [Planctomycetota bacterium]
MAVRMQLSRIIINENADQQYIFLKELDGERSFAIVIGLFEATSIDRRVKGNRGPRPLTHDLIANIIDQMGGEVAEVHITELKDATYFAKLKILHQGQIIEVDSRPSDAIAIAVTVKAPIFVVEDVLEELVD